MTVSLKEIAARHVEGKRIKQFAFPEIRLTFCVRCSDPWPCDASVLAGMLTLERLGECIFLNDIEHDDGVTDWAAWVGTTPDDPAPVSPLHGSGPTAQEAVRDLIRSLASLGAQP